MKRHDAHYWAGFAIVFVGLAVVLVLASIGAIALMLWLTS